MPKPKKCKSCGEVFEPRNTLQKACSIKCALDISRKDSERLLKRWAREERRRIRDNDRSHWLKKAQAAFNAWIRRRDVGIPCISCGTPDGKGKRNAGHYRPAGINSALRFEPDNVHGQCERCNTSLSGNLIEYRKGLVKKIGAERVEWLEQNHDIKRWSITELKEIEKSYKQK